MKVRMQDNLASTYPLLSIVTFMGFTIILYDIEAVRAGNFKYGTTYDG